MKYCPESTFHVQVHYREPTYEAWAGYDGEREPYRWTFEVSATNERQARERALQEFLAMERLSSVGWTRKVVRVDVRRGAASDPAA